VEEGIRACAHADRRDAADAELVEQREHVARNVGKPKVAAGIGRAAMTTEVRNDRAIAGERLGEDMLPVVAGSREAVQQQQRFAAAAVAEKQLDAVDVDRLTHAAIIAAGVEKKQTGLSVW
jgi:hypothetical protein